MKNAKAAGTRREHQVMRLEKDDGWVVVRAPGSLGAADYVALRSGYFPKFVQVKANTGSPYKSFVPAERRELAAVANQAGGEAWLAHWPPRGALRWYAEGEWPT